MAKNRIKFCTRCMNIIRKNDEKCSKCGYPVKKMQEELESKEGVDSQIYTASLKGKVLEENQPVAEIQENEVKNESEAQTETSKSEEGKTGTAQEYEEIDELTQDNMDMRRVGTVTFESDPNKPKRHKHKSKVKKEDKPKYTVDKDGSYNIDTSDVTYLEGVEKPTSSVKQARGDISQEKVEWWDIYKWADRMLAKRKIMKEVNKAARKTPEGISRGAMIAWCVFFGWLGIHNFCGKNYKKGWTVVIFDAIILPVILVPALYAFCGISVGGGLAFIVLAMWLLDLFGIITNRYRYRISKEEFISNLNVNTRAKLVKKYIDLDKATFKAKEKARLEKLYNKKNKKKNKKQNSLEK